MFHMQVGDRVIGVNEHEGLWIDGQIGTVVYCNPMEQEVCIEFDEHFDHHLHNGHGCVTTDKQNCWFINDPEHLELLIEEEELDYEESEELSSFLAGFGK